MSPLLPTHCCLLPCCWLQIWRWAQGAGRRDAPIAPSTVTPALSARAHIVVALIVLEVLPATWLVWPDVTASAWILPHERDLANLSLTPVPCDGCPYYTPWACNSTVIFPAPVILPAVTYAPLVAVWYSYRALDLCTLSAPTGAHPLPFWVPTA